jgi:hypothetical protein
MSWASGAAENKRRPQGGSWRTFAFLPHRAEAHTTVLPKSVGRAFRAILMLVNCTSIIDLLEWPESFGT